MNAVEKIKSPFLKYPGAKWKLAPWIISHMNPHHTVYTEVFGGGGNVLLRKEKCRTEVYNDLDSSLVNLFRVLRDNKPELEKRLRFTLWSREDYKNTWEKPNKSCSIEWARQTLVRAWMGFGGLQGKLTGFRTSIPQDSRRRATCADWSALLSQIDQIQARLQNVIIENVPAIDALSRYDRPDAVHVVDPPYLGELRKSNLYAYEMEDAESHKELAELLRSLKGQVLLCGYDSELYEGLFSGWHKAHKITTSNAGSGPTWPPRGGVVPNGRTLRLSSGRLLRSKTNHQKSREHAA